MLELLDATPALIRGEYRLLQRDNIHVSVKGNGIIVKGKGKLYMSSNRMIYVPKNANLRRHSQAFEIHYSGIRNESFNQPIFGANNITGRSMTTDGREVRWRLAFHSGGVGVFLKTFFRALNLARQQQSAQGAVVAEARFVAQQAQLADEVSSTMSHDRSDPSVVWVSDAVVVEATVVS